MRGFNAHFKKYMTRGMLAIIPLFFSILAIQFLYRTIDQRVMKIIDQVFGFSFPGLGLLLLVMAIYLTGLLASSLVGRQLLNLIDRVAFQMPLIKTTQKIGRQLVSMFSLPENQVFKRAVLVPFLKPGIFTVGFVTGDVINKNQHNEKLLKVFVPTPPNPLSGTMILIRESEILDPGWTVEDAIKTVISAGIIGPSVIGKETQEIG